VHEEVVIIYNDPVVGAYHSLGEVSAVSGVLDSVSAVRRTLAQLGRDCTVLPLRRPPARAKSQPSKLNATNVHAAGLDYATFISEVWSLI
jgi:hypothetical protein